MQRWELAENQSFGWSEIQTMHHHITEVRPLYHINRGLNYLNCFTDEAKTKRFDF